MEQPTLSELYRTLQSHVQESKDDRLEMKDMLEKQAEKLDKIEIQTTKTNGRVLVLESNSAKQSDHIDSLRLWRNLLIGGGIVVVALGALFAKLYVEDISRRVAQEVIKL